MQRGSLQKDDARVDGNSQRAMEFSLSNLGLSSTCKLQGLLSVTADLSAAGIHVADSNRKSRISKLYCY